MTALPKPQDRHRRIALAAACGAVLGWSALLASSPALAQIAQTPDEVHNGIVSSVSGSGLGQINQDAGESNNQANVTVLAFTGGDDSAALADVILSSQVTDAVLDIPPSLQSNEIVDSFNGFTGIVQVNQTTGGANAQANVIALAFAPGATFSAAALSDVDLSLVTNQTSEDPGTALPDSANTLSGSFNDFTGIAQVQQVAGDHNIITNVVAVAFGTGLP